MPKFLAIFFLVLFTLFISSNVLAQTPTPRRVSPTPSVSSTPIATDSATIATPSAQEREPQRDKGDITKPEESDEKQEVLTLFENRPTEQLTYLNFVAYIVQNSVKSGVPSNTVILILLLPILATIIAFLRHVVGLPSLELILPIALAITLIATGITTGLLLLLTILVASTVARVILKKIRIMQLPKLALSMFVVALFVFLSLTVMGATSILDVTQISIFPILLLILLSERIVALQLERSTNDTILITSATIIIAILGFFLLSNQWIRNFVLLYPEAVFILVPFNIAIGRYFGLRLTEYLRFYPVMRHGSK
jgi:hypothetical protein